VTQAMGRGATSPIKRLYVSRPLAFSTLNSMAGPL
jgi:hypothetical protein